ncbi:6-phosphogluconate dehydrogenase [Aerococcus sp. HMSC10H05]|nr:6-phosphogluconate dehydrogenase [Aerococcus sp. HMSC10H05]
MKIGIIGLGKMGANLALNALDHNWDIIGYDASAQARETAKQQEIPTVDSQEDLLDALDQQKIVLLSTPAGKVTNQILQDLASKLQVGDIIIDSGNSKYKDTLLRGEELLDKGIYLLDCGTSGGIDGARNGVNLMIGGDPKAFKIVEPFFSDIACKDGYLYSGPAGSGHYLKMVHNGIEYGMMQAIGEGFSVLEASHYDFDFAAVSKLWNNGSVIRSWLMALLEESFNEDHQLDNIVAKIDSSGEAKYTVEEALALEVPVPIIAQSLFVRNDSQLPNSFSNKVVSALRSGFGGHPIERK